MIYNIKIKYFPDGMKQYFLHSNPVETEYERPPTKEKQVDSARSKAVSKSRSKVSAYDLALSNHWDWFLTGTFNQEVYDGYDYGNFVRYIRLFTQQLRDRNIVYIIVPERHPTSGRWHFHALLRGSIPVVQAINAHTGLPMFDCSGRPIYNTPLYKYGFTTVTAVCDSRKASGYLAKYLTKADSDVPKGKKRYWASRSLNRPKVEYLIHDDIEYTFEAMKSSADYVKESITRDYGKFLFAEKH